VRAVRWWSAVALLVATTCTQRVDARIDALEGSRTPYPGFRISARELPRQIRFERIAEASLRDGVAEPAWTLLRDAVAASPPPFDFVYARPVRGYVASSRAALLFPGSYRLTVSFAEGAAVYEFVVTSDGRVTRPGLRN
jgi:hypothetical protein